MVMVAMHRCAVLALVALLCVVPALSIPASFNHGVASGDPMHDRMIIWTRITPRNLTATSYAVRYNCSQSASFSGPTTKTGTIMATNERDWTVKEDVTGLEPGKKYYYRFWVEDAPSQEFRTVAYSPIGQFKTPFAPGSKDQKQLKYGVFSCSKWDVGYFNAYDAASKLDMDFWVHLGDYIYEYANDNGIQNAVRYQEAPLGQQPKNEIVTLEDYHARHALHRLDPGLQALSAKAPLIAMWDDHETTNNARRDSAQNHQPETEGDYEERKRVSILAYHQWLPTRENDLVTGQYLGARYNRTMHFGNLATMLIMETRLTARDDEKMSNITAQVRDVVGNKNPNQWTAADKAALQKIKAESDEIASDPNYNMLGDTQIAWMEAETNKSVAAGVTWQLYGYGTVMQDTNFQDYEKAIEIKKKTNPEVAKQWEAAYKALVYNGPSTYKSYGLSCPQLQYYGASMPVTDALRATYRTNQAIGQYQIRTGYDAWRGFLAEKQKVLRIASFANNAAQYAGDSHADWVGIQLYNGKPVLGEFDVGGVTSNAYENGAVLPVDLLAEARVAGAYTSGLRKTYAGKKGFFYVELDDKVHHTEYIHVTTICSPTYRVTCDFAYDWYAKSNNKGDVVPSSCKSAKAFSGQIYNTFFGYNTAYPYIGQSASFLP